MTRRATGGFVALRFFMLGAGRHVSDPHVNKTFSNPHAGETYDCTSVAFKVLLGVQAFTRIVFDIAWMLFDFVCF